MFKFAATAVRLFKPTKSSLLDFRFLDNSKAC